MNPRAQWLFSEDELREVDRFRAEQYRQVELERVNEHLITKAQLARFIYFMRTRKKHLDYPLKFEKVIYYAVALYRRYYLLNIYPQDEPVRNLICAVYASLKLNEYDEGFITKMALKWKEKSVFCPTKRFPHYGEEGYTQAELHFLAGLRFQTALSKLIQPLEAIYEQINEVHRSRLPHDHEHKDKNVDFYELLPEVFAQLDRVYYHPSLMFLHDGARIALAIFVCILRRKHIPLGAMGDHLRLLAEDNLEEVNRIVFELELELDESSEGQDFARMRLPKFKKPDPKKSQSPRFQPRHDTFPSE